MSKPTVYLETTIPSYHVARPSSLPLVADYQRITREWWQRILPKCLPCISELVLDEIAAGELEMAEARRAALRQIAARELEATAAVFDLARDIVQSGLLPAKAMNDAGHIAFASFHRVDYLVTWNCRHINNAHIKRQIGRFLALRNIELPIICTPQELSDI